MVNEVCRDKEALISVTKIERAARRGRSRGPEQVWRAPTEAATSPLASHAKLTSRIALCGSLGAGIVSTTLGNTTLAEARVASDRKSLTQLRTSIAGALGGVGELLASCVELGAGRAGSGSGVAPLRRTL